MAPRRAESDFGLQGWIDTLGLKQIFLIFSVVLSCPSTSWGIYNSDCHVKRAAKTCNELNSDVACTATHDINLFCNKSGQCCRLRKVVAESWIVVLLFATKSILCCAFYRPKTNLYCSKWRRSRVILSNQKPVLTKLATSWFVSRQVFATPPPLPLSLFLSFFLHDKTSAAHVLSSCCFIPHAHFETSLVMVS